MRKNTKAQKPIPEKVRLSKNRLHQTSSFSKNKSREATHFVTQKGRLSEICAHQHPSQFPNPRQNHEVRTYTLLSQCGISGSNYFGLRKI